MILGRYKYIILFGLFMGMNSLYSQIVYTNVTYDAGIDHAHVSVTHMGGGAAFFDYDRDGDEDIWITGGMERDVLYENDGAGNFIEVGIWAGLMATQTRLTAGVVTGDLDNDGFRDVLVLSQNNSSPLLFRNKQNGTFSEVGEAAGLTPYGAQCYAAAIADVNADGWLDIYLATYVESINNIYDSEGITVAFEHNCFDNLLFINNGDWTFSEQSADYGVKDGGCALAATFTDFDQDNDADLLISNDFGEWLSPNVLYQNNQPEGAFSNVSQATGMDIGLYGMGIAVGDYDRDLDLDYYLTNLGRNVLLEQQPDGTFQDKAMQTGTEDTYMDSLLAVGWGTAFVDVDNDRDLDLFVCNGHIPAAPFIANPEENRNRLFLNEGAAAANTDFTFSEIAWEVGLAEGGKGRGFAYSDIDNDGDLDFLVINVNNHISTEPLQPVQLFRNDTENNNNWLKVELQGQVSNRDAFGAQIKIVLAEESWIHDYNGGFGSHTAQHSSIAHFGLGVSTVVDSLLIYWPSGLQHVFTNVAANQTLLIIEDGTTSLNQEQALSDIQISAFPNPFSEVLQVEFHLSRKEQLRIDLIDLLGRPVGQVGEGWYAEGNHRISWEAGTALKPGYYLLRLKSSNQTLTKNIVYLR